MSARFLLLGLLLAFAASSSGTEAEQEFYRDFYTRNFAGWQGVVFVCIHDPDDAVLAEICRRARVDIELLAVSHDVPLSVVPFNDLAAASKAVAKRGFLPLELNMHATKHRAPHATKAVHARLAYTLFYDQAVDPGTVRKSPTARPRSGDLEFWHRPLTMSGPAMQVAGPFADHLRPLLKRALRLFLEYRN